MCFILVSYIAIVNAKEPLYVALKHRAQEKIKNLKKIKKMY